VRRRLVVFGLIAAVLLAAIGLTYYSYRNTPSERLVILDTMRELAREKAIGIQTQIISTEEEMLERVDLDNPSSLQAQLHGSNLHSVMVLDSEKRFLPGGFFTKRPDSEIDEFRRLFLEHVVPDLHLDRAPFDQRRSLHASYDRRPYLFAFMRRKWGDKTYFVVVETEINYIVAYVLSVVLDAGSGRHLYQVVDRSGGLVYGPPFSEVPERDVVEQPFIGTLGQWRLRVAPRDASLLASRATRRATLDLVLIATMLGVILAGVAVGLVAVVRERRLNELKSEFISNMSHELKTPLSIISMFGELLSMGRTRSAAQATEYAEIIRRESNRLSRLIDSVLDFSKIERGVDVYEFTDGQDLREVVGRALDLSRHRLDQARMTLETDLADDLPPMRIDTNAVTVAVLNLVDNAIKYAADGKVLAVRLRSAAGGVELDVCDSGPGVPSEEREAIFDRFYRARAVRQKPIRGSGIGLALVKHIAQAHGGEVSVRAGKGGQGAVFRLWLPTAVSRRAGHHV
jgi:two-component system, OmpR family, phosphate regulon sensor histidine kinase PhoR